MIDYAFCLMPLFFIVTIFSEYISTIHFVLMLTILVLYKYLDNKQIKSIKFENNSKVNSIEEKVIRLSISTCRLWLYMLTTVSILAVDFKIFPRYNAKTENYGISLMDLGVGFYIVCHSMKLIRNSDNLSDNNKSQLVE